MKSMLQRNQSDHFFSARRGVVVVSGFRCERFLPDYGQKFRTTQRRTRGVTWQYGRQTLKGNVWQK